MIAFLIITTIIFGLLALVWSTEGLLNFCLKAMFFGMTAWSLLLSLEALGYLIKT